MPNTLANTVANWNELVVRWAKKRNIPASLILAVIHKESKGNEQARGLTADYGLMQITQPALTDFNKANSKSYQLSPDMFDPEKNVEVGSWYLVWVKNFLKTDKWIWILRGYNAGVGVASKEMKAGAEAPPGNYSAQIMVFQEKIRAMGA